jgi:hypothetical protein
VQGTFCFQQALAQCYQINHKLPTDMGRLQRPKIALRMFSQFWICFWQRLSESQLGERPNPKQ